MVPQGTKSDQMRTEALVTERGPFCDNLLSPKGLQKDPKRSPKGCPKRRLPPLGVPPGAPFGDHVATVKPLAHPTPPNFGQTTLTGGEQEGASTYYVDAWWIGTPNEISFVRGYQRHWTPNGTCSPARAPNRGGTNTYYPDASWIQKPNDTTLFLRQTKFLKVS